MELSRAGFSTYYANYGRAANDARLHLARLSTGCRINRAADDASGLAISEKMKAQINGLDAASENIQNGVSLVQTADSALAQAGDTLLRMRALALRAADGTLSDGDRAKIGAEMAELTGAVDAIAAQTSFNGIKLLAGSQGSVHLIAKEADISAVAGITGVSVFPQSTVFTAGISLGLAPIVLSDSSAVFTFSSPPQNAHMIYVAPGEDVKSTLQNLLDTFNSIKNDTSGDPVISAHRNFILSSNMQMQLIGVDAVMITADYNGTYSNYQTGYVPGEFIQWSLGGYGQRFEFAYHEEAADDAIVLQVGADDTQTLTVARADISPAALGINGLSVLTREDAGASIAKIDAAADRVMNARSKFAACQTSLCAVAKFASGESENLSAAQSMLADADMPGEMMELIRSRLLVSASQFCLSQASALSRGVTAYLRA